MDSTELAKSFITIGGYIAFIAGGVFYARSKVPSQTITNYKDLAESQEKRIKALEDQAKVDHQNHLENIKAIADLQGQIKVYKELPLQEMAGAMQKISDTNQLILSTLQNDARILQDEKAHIPLAKGTTTTVTTK